MADWPQQRIDRCAPLIGLIGTAFTLVDRCAELYTATTLGGLEIHPIDSQSARMAYQDHVRGLLTRLTPADLQPRQEISWLTAIDEALRSFFPLPFPSQWSWWSSRLGPSLELLTRCAGEISAHAQVTLIKWGDQFSSAERKAFAGTDTNLPIVPAREADLGRVLWPLRVYVALPASPPEPPRTTEGRVAYGHEHGYRKPER